MKFTSKTIDTRSPSPPPTLSLFLYVKHESSRAKYESLPLLLMTPGDARSIASVLHTYVRVCVSACACAQRFIVSLLYPRYNRRKNERKRYPFEIIEAKCVLEKKKKAAALITSVSRSACSRRSIPFSLSFSLSLLFGNPISNSFDKSPNYFRYALIFPRYSDIYIYTMSTCRFGT